MSAGHGGAYATLPGVSDPLPRQRGGAAGTGFSAADVARITSGRLLRSSRTAHPRRRGRFAPGRARPGVRRAARRAHGRPRVPGPGGRRRCRGAHRQPAARRRHARGARRRDRRPGRPTACGRSARSAPDGGAGSTPLVVGITGSIAKTSTKEAVATVLGRRFTTLRSEGNQNNEIGLPLTLLRLGPEHEAAVLEMGMYTAARSPTWPRWRCRGSAWSRPSSRST